MLKRLLAAFALKLIDIEDAFVRIEYMQNASEGTWEATLTMLNSKRDWSVTFWFPDDLEERLQAQVVSACTRDGHRFHVPQKLATNRPLKIAVRSTQLAHTSGLVNLTLESKARVGGSGMGRWIPIGFADPGLIERYDESAVRMFENWKARRELEDAERAR